MKKRPLLSLLKQVLPWLMVIGIFYYLFSQYPPSEVFGNLKEVNWILLLPLAIFYITLITIIDSYGLAWCLSKFYLPVTFKEMLAPRLTSYLLAIINYNAGQATIALYLKKSHNYPMLKSLGAIMLLMLTDFFLIITIGFTSSLFIELYVKNIAIHLWVQKVGFAFYSGIILYWLFRYNCLDLIIPKKIKTLILHWMETKHFFQALNMAKPKDYAQACLIRLPMHASIMVMTYFLFICFNAHVDFQRILLTLPMALIIGGIPITPGGLGTIQVALVEFLKDYIHSPLFDQGITNPEQLILGSSLIWLFLNYLIKATAGLIAFIKVRKVIYANKSTNL